MAQPLIAGLRYPEVDVPLGTYNGWSLRKAGYAEGEQFWNTGSFVPFARTRAEREASGDPRPSLEERYGTHAAYVAEVRKAAEARVAEGLLLAEDAERIVNAAQERNPFDPSARLGPLIFVLVGRAIRPRGRAALAAGRRPRQPRDVARHPPAAPHM